MSTDVSFRLTTNRPIHDKRFTDNLCEDKNISHSAARQSVKSIFEHTQSKEEINIDDRPPTFPCKIFVRKLSKRNNASNEKVLLIKVIQQLCV